MKSRLFLPVIAGLGIVATALTAAAEWIEPVPSERPSAAQQVQIDRKYGMFCHFGINTYAGTEWTDGTVAPEVYAPPADIAEKADAWVKTARDAGMRYFLCITKHHDGFCLWDSKHTEYFMPFEATVTVSKKNQWFGFDGDHGAKPVDELEQVFRQATANNNLLVLNIPPGKDGVLIPSQVQALMELGKRLKLSPGKPFPEAMPVLASAALARAGDGDLRLNDFEGADYGAWKTEGAAFGTGPAQGTLPGQMEVTGFLGKGLVNTFLGGDGPTGKLTSPEFSIERDYLTFLIGGGGHQGKTCMNLSVGGVVVLTATGPNTEPGGSESLNWENWDVPKYRGKKAVIQIVDDASGGWGHINVDQIVQSNTLAKKRPQPPVPVDNALEIKITGKYLLIPVSNKGRRGRMTIRVGGQLVHNLDCDFAPDKDSIDWWAWLDMSEYLGKTARISARAIPEVAAMIESSNQLRNLQPLYDEALRPQFHMSQMRGWNNDPNGMCYYDGEYHFFWQSNPAGAPWANMYWGHSTSPDMVHWTEQTHALRPFGGEVANRHPSMAVASCFSGGGNVDTYNTGGWQKGSEKTMVLVFTDTGCGESIAYSTDRGRSWTCYEGNPVIKHSGRDPKLIWYAPGKHWVITLFDERAPYGQNISIYTSKDLKQWEYASSIPGYYECAELFELPVDGNQANKKWVVFAADARYAVGNFDGRKFTPEHQGKHQVHWGPYYASQCFSNPPDGRVVQIGWARIDMPGMPFNQTFSLPTHLTLHATDEGIRMFAAPIKELEALRKPNPQAVSNKDLAVATPAVEFDAAGQLYDILVTVKKGTAAQAVLRFGDNAVTYDFGTRKLDEMPLKMQDDKVTFRVLVDRPMFEAVGGGGACYKTAARRDMGKPLGKISLSAQGGTLTVESLVVHEMTSTWNTK